MPQAGAMRVEVAEVVFDVGPDRLLTEAERAALIALDQSGSVHSAQGPGIRLEIVPGDRIDDPRGETPENGPAAVLEIDGRIRLRHAKFEAELEPLRRKVRLQRDPSTSAPLEVTLRTALCCALPLERAVALHAAGIVIDGRGAVFFGPSGAGKTTLSRSSPHPVLSDELVVVSGRPWKLRPSGAWGELGTQATSPVAAPLQFLAALEKGSDPVLTPLEPDDAIRKLLGVVVLPPSARLWERAFGVIAELVRTVPTYRLEWCPSTPPWQTLERTTFRK